MSCCELVIFHLCVFAIDSAIDLSVTTLRQMNQYSERKKYTVKLNWFMGNWTFNLTMLNDVSFKQAEMIEIALPPSSVPLEVDLEEVNTHFL